MEKPRVFFGYANTPELVRETISAAAASITKTDLVESRSWEQLSVVGRLVVDQVFEAIDESALAAFDISTLSENVLFELGYAIARGKRVWLLIDKTDREAVNRWRQFRLLSTIGYQGWANSDDIRDAFIQHQPHLADNTIYDDLIESSLTPQIEGSLFYYPSLHPTEASKRIGRVLDVESRRGVRLISADPTESAIYPISWYAQKVYETAGTIVHLVSARREHAWLHNARAALVAGLAVGFERPTLLLAEDDYVDPLDYRDRLRRYESAVQAQEYVSLWLTSLVLEPQPDKGGRRLKLVTELRGLKFGEPVAENEADVLADYFLETAAFDEVLTSKNTLFIGRKGSGKTANMLQAAARLSEDARNLVIVIKPQSYELEGLVALLARLSRDVRIYTINSLWTFLLQSEIAKTAVQSVELRPPGVPMTESERQLLAFVNETDFGLREEFAVRFERTVRAIEDAALVDASSINQGRDLLHEALHENAIRRLRKLIGPVVKGRNRVAILIDNLDKAWDRQADLDAVSQLLLGLISAIGRVSVEYEKEDFWRDRISLSLATFLRSDIYAHLQRVAREPDKIPANVLSWRDPELLLRVIEERFLAVRPTGTDASQLWTRFFCHEVGGRPVKEYLTWRSLPRPRDIVYLCNAATTAAVNAQHDLVSEKDFLLAEQNYSQWALEALLVENGITITQLENVLFEFAGSPSIVGRSKALANIRSVVGDAAKADYILGRLLEVSFLGREVSDDRFAYPEVGPDSRKVDVLSRKLAEHNHAEPRLEIHPAYRPYLEISDLGKSM